VSERTYRRQYRQTFGFVELNQHTIAQAIGATADTIAAIDCSFVPKSGKTTYGLDWFYNGSASRSEKGLEISVIAVIDVSAHRAYTLSVQQTPPNPVPSNSQTKGKAKGRQTVSRQTIEQISEVLKQLPEQSEASQTLEQSFQPEITRVDSYLNQLKATHPHFPVGLRYLVGDGFYSKQKFVDGVVALHLDLILHHS
jgi:DDE superfamily endonuclease